MEKLFFITGNEHKFEEVKKLIPYVQKVSLDLPEIQSLDPHEVIAAKLLAAKSEVAGPCIVEDTSLSMSGLNGLPGTFIKFFCERLSLEKIAALVASTGDTKAVAKVCIGFMDGDNISFFEGEVRGSIVPPRGEDRFTWDRMFLPDGFEKTFAQMSLEEKNKLSMRSLAVKKLVDFLKAE